MARVVPVCSSSKGNSVFVGDSTSGVLIDAGCSFKALKDGLALCGIPFEAVKAVLVTHEHIDHTKALGQITKEQRFLFMRPTVHRKDCSRIIWSNSRQ